MNQDATVTKTIFRNLEYFVDFFFDTQVTVERKGILTLLARNS